MKTSRTSTFAERSARARERRLARQPSLRAAGGLPRQTPESIRKHLKERDIYKPWVDKSRSTAQVLPGASKVSKFHFDPEVDSDTELVIIGGPSPESDNMPNAPKVEAKLQPGDEAPVQVSESLSRGDKINFINHCFRRRGQYLATVTNSEKVSKAKEAQFWLDMRATSTVPFKEGTYITASKIKRIVTGTCTKRRKESIPTSSRLAMIPQYADLQHAMDLWIPIWKLWDALSNLAKAQTGFLEIFGQAVLVHQTGKRLGPADSLFTPIILLPKVKEAIRRHAWSLMRPWEGTLGEVMRPAEVELWPSQVSIEADSGETTTDNDESDESDEEDKDAIPSVEETQPPATSPAMVAKLKRFEVAFIAQELRNGKKANAVTGYVSPPNTSPGGPQDTNLSSRRSKHSVLESPGHQDASGASRLRTFAEINGNAEAPETRGKASPKEPSTDGEQPSPLRNFDFEKRRSANVARIEKATGVSMILAVKPPPKPKHPRKSKSESRSDASSAGERHVTRARSRVGRDQDTSDARAETEVFVADKSITALGNPEDAKSKFPKGEKGKRKWQEQLERDPRKSGTALMSADTDEYQRRKNPRLGDREMPVRAQAPPPSELPQDQAHAAQRLDSKKTSAAPRPSTTAASSGKSAPASVPVKSQTPNGVTTITTNKARSAPPERPTLEIPKTSSSAVAYFPSHGGLGIKIPGIPHVPVAGLGNSRYDGASATKSERKGHGELDIKIPGIPHVPVAGLGDSRFDGALADKSERRNRAEGGDTAARDGPPATAPAPPQRSTNHATIHTDTARTPNRGVQSTHGIVKEGCEAPSSSHVQPYLPRSSAPALFRPHIQQNTLRVHAGGNGEPAQPSWHQEGWEHEGSLASHAPRHGETTRIIHARGGDREVTTLIEYPQGTHTYFGENGEPRPRGFSGKPTNPSLFPRRPSPPRDGGMRHPATQSNDIPPRSVKSAGSDRSPIRRDRSHSLRGSRQSFGAATPGSVASSNTSSGFFVKNPQVNPWPSHDFLHARHISSERHSALPFKREDSVAPGTSEPRRSNRAEKQSDLFLPEANPDAEDTEMAGWVKAELTPAQLSLRKREKNQRQKERRAARTRTGEKPTKPCDHCQQYDHWTYACPTYKAEKKARRRQRRAAQLGEIQYAPPPKARAAPQTNAGKRKAGEMEGSYTTARKETRSQSVGWPTKRFKYGVPIVEQHSPAWHAGHPFKMKPSPLKRNFTERRFRAPREPLKRVPMTSQPVTTPGPSYSRSASVVTDWVKGCSPETQAELLDLKYKKAKKQIQSASVENANLKEENERLRRRGGEEPRGHGGQT